MASKIAKMFLIIFAILAVFLISVVLFYTLRMIADRKVSKNNKKYFDLNKAPCERNIKKAKKVLELLPQYENYVRELSLNEVIRCSNSVVSNSRSNPVKYLLKYSNIEKTMEDVEKLDLIFEFVTGYESFILSMADAGREIREKLPLFYRLFCNKKKLPYLICGLDYELANIKKPFVAFLYVSPAGRSSNSNKIELDAYLIKQLISEISDSLGKKGHSKHQRSMMSNDLREAIKKRDNYTCCICGNSVYNEPNLLLEVDHIIPVSKGGKTEASNLQTLCWRCNRSKSDKE